MCIGHNITKQLHDGPELPKVNNMGFFKNLKIIIYSNLSKGSHYTHHECSPEAGIPEFKGNHAHVIPSPMECNQGYVYCYGLKSR